MNFRSALCLLSLALALPGCVIAVGNTTTSSEIALEGSADRRLTQVLEIAPGETLFLDTSFGDVRVRAAEEEPTVVADLRVFAATDAEAKRALAGYTLSLFRTSRGIEARVTGETKGPGAPSVSFTAVVPRDILVVLGTSSGEIEITGPIAGCQAVTSFGDIDIENVRGRVKAVTSSGDIEVTGVERGDLHLETSFGDIVADGSLLALSATTSSGSITLTARRGSRVDDTWRVETSFGDVTLALAAAISGNLTAETSFGTVSSTYPDGERPKSLGATRMDLNLGGTGGLIRLKTSSGDVTVRQL
jgi:DUF4097 and DUF4098 domain-containing protein YvlB